VSTRVTIATAQRVLWQIRRDPRTIALLLVVPCLLLVLLRFVFDGREQTFQHIGAPLCGLFPFIIMFLVTSITMLRERTTGTLERLMTLPLAKLDLLVGYGIAVGVMAAAQAIAVCVVGFVALGLESPHGALLIGALAVGNALLGMALGLFVSAFARTEFQAVQFMPAFILPQLLVVRAFRGSRGHGRIARVGLLGTAAHLCLRCPPARDGSGGAERSPGCRCGGGLRCHCRRPRPRRPDAAPTDRLSLWCWCGQRCGQTVLGPSNSAW
jgi:ABC-2 type transport system permease protein